MKTKIILILKNVFDGNLSSFEKLKGLLLRGASKCLGSGFSSTLMVVIGAKKTPLRMHYRNWRGLFFEGPKGSRIFDVFDWVTLLSRNAELWLEDFSFLM